MPRPPTMALAQRLETLRRLLGPRGRRAWAGNSRAHVEFPKLDPDELQRLEKCLEERARSYGALKWVRVNPHLKRVVFAFDAHAYAKRDLVALVEAAERDARVEIAGFEDSSKEHPADTEPIERLLVGLSADALSGVVAAALALSPLGTTGVSGGAASLLQLLRSSPRLRRGLDARFGLHRNDLVLSLLVSTTQALAQRPGSALVELCHKAILLREARSRYDLWHRLEPDLESEAATVGAKDSVQNERPIELPSGPIEEYTDRAWLIALAGFGVNLLTTRSVERATGALFGGLPKPARLGRDSFAGHLGTLLARRGVLVLDSEVLRRLDRIDCVVLQGQLVAHDRLRIGDIVVAGAVDLAEVKLRVAELFDPERPLTIQFGGEWTLGPVQLLDATLEPTLENAAHAVAQRGELVLGLEHSGVLCAVVEMTIVPQTGIEELIEVAHRAQMSVVVASDDDSVLAGLAADDTISEADGMRAGIRRLQREGRGVCVVATASCPGLALADCGVELLNEGRAPSWAGHIVCPADLSEVRFLLEACVAARRVARQSVNIALGSASVGALVSAVGLLPMTGRRVLAVVNSASMLSMANGFRSSSVLGRRVLPEPRDRTPWHALDAEGVVQKLGSSPAGLSRQDVDERRGRTAEANPKILDLLEAVSDELFSPLAPLLAAGAGISAVVGSLGDAAMVGGVVAFNAVVGGVQRYRTEQRIQRLERGVTRPVRVLRDGVTRSVVPEDLVKGDIVLLASGDVVPADCRLVRAEALEIDASSLTGESLPVRKSAAASFETEVADRSSMLYAGTSVASGQATAIVVAVGAGTEARRGAASVRRTRQSGVERRLRSLVDLTGPVALGSGLGLVLVGLLRGRKLPDLVGSAVSLAVASVPEGLPLLATAAQLAAADRLSERGALVRNARSIEALGRVDTLCLDKTGTVTEGRVELSVVSDGWEEEALTDLGPSRVRVLSAALRTTPPLDDAATADQIDLALIRAGRRAQIGPRYNAATWAHEKQLSFDSERAYQAVLGTTGSDHLLSVKGAPETILARCSRCRRGSQVVPLDAALTRRLGSRVADLARRGLRVLAVAERELHAGTELEPTELVGLTLQGFLAFSDPVRPAAAQALERLRRARVRALLVTGDHPSTAETIASELGLLDGKRVLTGAELTRLSDAELDDCLDEVSVFARVTPSQKVRIVRALQRVGRTVAMAGDGSNDAPAIRLAEVGIAVGARSAAAARTAADVVLTDERLETLVEALVEGRAMWASVRDAVAILVGGNLGEIAFTLGGGLVDGRPPLNARQLLLVNLLTDVAPAIAVALRPPSEATLAALADEGPEASLGNVLTREIAARAAVTALGAGGAWTIARLTGAGRRAGTIGLLALVGTQLAQTVSAGKRNPLVLKTSLASVAVLAAIVQTPGISGVFGCRPVGPIGWATAAGASVAATALGRALPRLIEELGARLTRERPVPFAEPEALPGPAPSATRDDYPPPRASRTNA